MGALGVIWHAELKIHNIHLDRFCCTLKVLEKIKKMTKNFVDVLLDNAKLYVIIILLNLLKNNSNDRSTHKYDYAN